MESTTESTTDRAYEIMDLASGLYWYLTFALDAQRDTGALGNKALAALDPYTYVLTGTESEEAILEALEDAFRELRGCLDRTRDAEKDERYQELRSSAAELFGEFDAHI